MTALTRSRIEDAFDRLGELAFQRGLAIEIAVYGGSCLLTRPGTLREVLRRVREEGADFSLTLASFLDGFYGDRSAAGRRARVEEDPGLTGDALMDAWIGGIGEHLCRRWCLGEPPDWTNAPERFLRSFHFQGPERMKPILLAESPMAFRRRMIFTEAEPLRRMSMPKDGRWWAYETLRTGRVPEPDEIEPPCVPAPAQRP